MMSFKLPQYIRVPFNKIELLINTCAKHKKLLFVVQAPLELHAQILEEVFSLLARKRGGYLFV